MYFFKNKIKYILTVSITTLLLACNNKPTILDYEVAINKDDLKAIHQLNKKINVDTLQFFNGRTILHLAVMENATTISKKLIEDELYIHKIDSSGQTPFTIAVMGNNNVISEYLLTKNIDINKIDYLNGYAPLHYAVDNENLVLVKKIVEKGADINLKTNRMQNTALHRAIYKGNPAIINYLLNKNAQDTITNLNGDNAINYAIESLNVDVLSIFLDDFSVAQKKELFATAIRSKSEHPLLEKLLKENWVSKKLLQENFIFVHNTTTAKKLLNYGCNINYISKEKGYGAIHYAAIRGDVEMLQFLITNGADINAISSMYTKEKYTPLMHAAALYDDVIINQKVDDILVTLSTSAEEALGVSNDKTKGKSLDCVKFLIEKGANLNYVNNNNENVLYIAAATFNYDVKVFLKEKGVKETKIFKPKSNSILSRINN